MIESYATAILGIAGLMTGWAFVQRAWGRVFFPESPGDDVLERRGGCGNCGCVKSCQLDEPEPNRRGRLSIEDGTHE